MWTKLQLEGPQHGEAARIQSELTSSNQPSQKSPVEIVADFLAQVKAHIVKHLNMKYGEDLWRTLPIILVVTFPAVWSDAAKSRTLEAVDKAGLNKLEFPQLLDIKTATEPEAAALYTIKNLRGTAQEGKLEVGHGFTVCDMGGGTVDLVSYKIITLNPILVKEATLGNGDQCGGSFVDLGFFKFLERRLGTQDFVDITGCRSDQIRRTNLTKKAATLLQDFTMECKSGFSGTESYYLRLPPPLCAIGDDEIRGICDGELKISADDMCEMFEYSIRRTYELLMEQWQRAKKNKIEIKYVFLVGGFSESPYINSKIKSFVLRNNMTPWKPIFAWSAVVRGAAAKGLDGGKLEVLTRKSRRHYGTSCSRLYDRRKHTMEESFINKYHGGRWAGNQMEWLIEKGQDLDASETTHASAEMLVTFWLKESMRKTKWKLLACDNDEAPQRADAPSVRQITTLSVDFSNVPKAEMEIEYSQSGKRYYSFIGVVHISMQAKLDFFVTVNNKRYGSLTAAYD